MTPGLIERLEKAESGSRELDCEIMALTYRWEQRHIGGTCWDDYQGTCCPGARHLDWVWVDPEDDKWKTTAREGYEFTTSLDAALALAERMLPGCCPGIAKNVHYKDWYAWLGDKEEEGPLDLGNGRSSSPALALTAAILKARATSKPKEGGRG